MNDLSTLLRSVYRTTLFFILACLMMWAFVPMLKPYAAGLALGTCISLLNAWILQMRIYKITQVALENSGKRVHAGFAARASMVLLGTMISVRFPVFHLACTISGFFFVQLATLIFGFVSARQYILQNEKR